MLVRPWWILPLLLLTPVPDWSMAAGLRACCGPDGPLNESEWSHLARYLVNMNEVVVETQGEIDPSRVRIEWEGEMVRRRGLSRGLGWVVFDGRPRRRVGYDYGPNGFDVSYDGQLLGSAGLWKMNNWHSNRYTFVLHEDQGRILVDFLVEGPDAGQESGFAGARGRRRVTIR